MKKDITIPKKTISDFINESKFEVSEVDISKVARELKTLSRDAKISLLAREFITTEKAINAALGKEFSLLEKELKSAINADIRAGFLGKGISVGPKTKEASKMLAVKEIMDSKTVLNGDDIIKIIEKNKAKSRQFAVAAETKAAQGAASGGSGPTPGPGGSGPTPGPGPGGGGKFSIGNWKDFIKKNPYKTAATALAVIGIPAFLVWNRSDDPNKGPAPKKSEGFPPCVAELIDANKAQLFDEGYAFIKTPTYPDGLKFYLNGNVINAKNWGINKL
jgi:hypothetical protein